MPKSIIPLALAGLLAAGASSVSATERVLLAPPSAAGAPMAGARSTAAAPVTTTKETLPGTIARLRAAATKDGRVNVIVGFSVLFAPELELSEAERAQQQKEITLAGEALRKRYAAANKRGSGIRTFSSVPFAAMQVTANELNQLLADPAIATIVEDQTITPQMTNSAPQIGAPAAWALGATGKGQTVAIIDWGFESNHPFFRDPATGKSKMVYEAACTGSTCTPGPGQSRQGRDSHGNSVAGIIAGERPESSPGKGNGLKGIAPDAKLMTLSAYTTSAVINALNNIYQQRNNFKIAAVNMSLAWSTDTPNGRAAFVLDTNTCRFYSPAVSAAISNLRAAGTATVISSGNYGGKPFGLGSTDKLSFPACLPDAVSVGAVFSDRRSGGWTLDGLSAGGTVQRIKQDEVIYYSNAAPSLTFVAPGYPIETAVTGGQYTRTFEGTSAAAPHVAGAFAVLRSAAPNATVDQIIEALRITGKPVKDYRTNRITPRIDVAQALAYLQGGAKSVIAYTKTGDGGGTVTFAPVASRESCDDDCNSFVASGASITITAKPEPGMEFLGWEGECKSSKSPSCTFTAGRQLTQVTAKFGRIKGWASYMLSYSRSGIGRGSVSASINGKPIDCREIFCNHTLPAGTLVTLSVTVGDDANFTGWTGPCSGTAPTCSFVLNSTTRATAGFSLKSMSMVSLIVMKSGAGALSATLDDKPVACAGLFCTITGPAGATVKLTATPDKTSTFGGWSGLCTGTAPDCSVKLQTTGVTTASFRARPGKLAAAP